MAYKKLIFFLPIAKIVSQIWFRFDSKTFKLNYCFPFSISIKFGEIIFIFKIIHIIA